MNRFCRTLICLFALGAAPFYAAPHVPISDGQPYIHFHGKRLEKKTGAFLAVGVKVSGAKNGFLTLDIYFNESINSASVQESCFLINGNPLTQAPRFYFSKTGKMLRFNIKNPENVFTLTVKNILSYTDMPVLQTDITGLQENSFAKYAREEQVWKKS